MSSKRRKASFSYEEDWMRKQVPSKKKSVEAEKSNKFEKKTVEILKSTDELQKTNKTRLDGKEGGF